MSSEKDKVVSYPQSGQSQVDRLAVTMAKPPPVKTGGAVIEEFVR